MQHVKEIVFNENKPRTDDRAEDTPGCGGGRVLGKMAEKHWPFAVSVVWQHHTPNTNIYTLVSYCYRNASSERRAQDLLKPATSPCTWIPLAGLSVSLLACLFFPAPVLSWAVFFLSLLSPHMKVSCNKNYY